MGGINELRALLRAGRAGEGVVLAQKLAAQHPADAGVLTYFGMAQAMVGDASGAIETLERAVRADPSRTIAMVQLSNALRMDERLDASLQWARRALAVDPAHELALSAAAELLVLLDRAAEARELLEPAVSAGGGESLGSVGVAWGKTMKSLRKPERAIEVVRAVCEDNSESDDARSGAVYVLGDLLLASGRHGEAFEAFAQANSMRGGSYSVGDAVRSMATLRQGWTVGAIARAPKAAGEIERASERCVFIVGMPRSGTTLAERVLDAHPGAVGVGESPIVGRVAAELARGMGVGYAHTVQTPALLTSRVATERGGQIIESLRQRAERMRTGAGDGGEWGEWGGGG